MNEEFEIFKKSLEDVNNMITPPLSAESIEIYLSELDINTPSGLKPSILIIDTDIKMQESLQSALGKNTI